MTIGEILSNEELRRHEFPVTGEKIFLAHAAVCALPRRVAEAVRDYALKTTLGDQEESMRAAQISRARSLAAKLVGGQPEEMAFVGPTSLALSFVAGGLPWREGDNVLLYFEDYPSNVYPWLALAERGVEARRLKAGEYGRIEAGEVMAQIDERTRLVALASNHFVAGYRPDLEAIGKALREREILFCVDGIQTVGAFPTDVAQIDFLAADAHKWMLGPCGAGIFHVRKSLQARLRPVVHGWHNIRCPNFVAQEHLVWRPDAGRYEAGTANLLGLAGLNAAMELLLEIGVENIAARLLHLRALLARTLQEKGWTVLQAGAPARHASGIVSFWRPEADLPALHKKLLGAKIETSLRGDREGRHYIRVSPHFYNTDEEIQRLLEMV
jgi:selenocysteine lyase/cysteine desulfurase